jgi:hypothetical protein
MYLRSLSRLGLLALLPTIMTGAAGCDVATDDASDAAGDARQDGAGTGGAAGPSAPDTGEADTASEAAPGTGGAGASEMDALEAAPDLLPDLAPDVAPEVPAVPPASLRLVFTSARNTSERGTQATFTVALDGDPAANVTFALSSSNVHEGTVSPMSLTFTPANARAPQTVTVTGVDDGSMDGDAAFQIVFGPAASLDPNFAGMSGAPVEVVNLDDEHAGFVALQAGALSTSEAGKQAQFAVVATAKPAANVTLPVASADPSEGTVSPASLVFTPDNWDAPQLVTVIGVDDSDADGTQQFGIVLGPSTSSDSAYVGLQAAGPTVSNADDESPGVVTAGANLHTSEGGGQATFTVALQSRPTGDVTIPVTSGDGSEGQVTPTLLTFTPVSWNAPQTVTVTGVDDALADGNQLYAVVLGGLQSTDPAYAAIDPTDVMVSNVDNDSPGVTVIAAAVAQTSEAGATAQVALVLNSQPIGDVSFAVSSSDVTEGTVSPATLTFTAADWNAPHVVTVTGVDDAVADGNQVYAIAFAPATSSDSNYAGLDPADVPAQNVDNDSAGITVAAGSLVTTEAAGTATFTVVLNSMPTANVTIALGSSDTSEGTVTPSSLLFTPTSWNAPQSVTVTGVGDDLADGNQGYTIVTAPAASADPGYANLDAANVALTNTDDDTAGFTVGTISGKTTEAGGQASFTLKLNSEPTADVVIFLTSTDTGEGTVSPTSLTFTHESWKYAQSVTVTGADDAIADGEQAFNIALSPAVSGDSTYAGRDAPDVAVQNVDNDSAGITVTAGTLVTSEAGGTATFSVVLNSMPTANVTIGLSSSDTTEGTVAPASLVFTSANWSTPQGVTVTGVSDNLNDGNQSYSVITAPAASSDPGYAGRDAANVAVSNTDAPGGVVLVRKQGIATSERGAAVTFDVVLTRAPSAPVHIPLSSSDPGEAQVGASELVFGADSWNVPQTLSVVGVDDQLEDGPQPFTLVLGPLTSTDPDFAGVNPPDVDLRNLDNDYTSVAAKTLIANHNCIFLSQFQRIASDESGNIYVAVPCGVRNVAPDPWGDPLLPPSIMVSRDGGKTFGPQVEVTGISKFIDFRGGPAGEAFVIGVTPSKKITFSRTEDAGVTWSPAIELFTAEMATLAVTGKHVVIAEAYGQQTLQVSHDGGRNFSQVQGNIDNWFTHLSVKPDGTLWTYRQFGVASVFARSTDDGKTLVPLSFPFPTYALDPSQRSASFGADILVTQGSPPGAGDRTLVKPLSSAPAFTLPPKASLGPLISADDTNTFVVVPMDSPPRKVFWHSPNDADFAEGPALPIGHGDYSVTSLSDSALAVAYVTQEGLYFTVVVRP